MTQPGVVRTKCRSLALAWCWGMTWSCPPGIPPLQLGPGGSERPLPLPGPAEAAGAHYSIGKEFGAAFRARRLPGAPSHIGNTCARAGEMLPLPSHGVEGRQLRVPQMRAPMCALLAPVSNEAMQGQQSCCPFGRVMRNPRWSPLPPWDVRTPPPTGDPHTWSQGLGKG